MEHQTLSGGTHLIDPLAILKKLELKNEMKIGDLGCGGAGHFAFPAANMVAPDGIVYAVDVLKSVLQNLKSQAKLTMVDNVITVWADLEVPKTTKIVDESLDAVFLHNILHQAKHREAVFKEALRVLKPDGKILVLEWKEDGGKFGPPKNERLKPEAIEELARLGEMATLEKFDAGEYHYGYIFEKSIKE